MKISIFTLLAVLLLAGPSHGFYTFDNDAQGWKMADTDTWTYDQAAYHSGQRGLPPGSIHQTDEVATDASRAYSLGLDEMSNPLGILTGRIIHADLYSDGNWVSNAHARWFIGSKAGDKYNHYVSKRAFAFDLDHNGWKSTGMVMDADNFFRWPNKSAASGSTGYKEFDSLLTDYTTIGLALYTGDSNEASFWSKYANIGYFGASADSDSATWGLDNVSVEPVPAPAAAWLLFSGIIGLIGMRRFKSW